MGNCAVSWVQQHKEALMMEISNNTRVSCKLLSRLMERAWDEGDMLRLYELSQAMDSLAAGMIRESDPNEQAI